MLLDYFVIAWNSLAHKKLRSWLTIIGILIGVIAVVALISLGDGLKAAVNSQFGISSTEVISVQAGGLTGYGPPGTGVINPLIEDDVEAIGRLGTVERAVRRNVVSGKLEFNDIVVFGYATNIPDGDNRKFVYEQVELEAEVGRMLKDGDTNKVVLGNNFYTDSVGLGKKIVPGNTIILQDEKFEVVGILKKKGSFIFDNIVLVNEKPLDISSLPQ
jgi:putative ABC transport system permease protein